jgi:glutamine synthetase
MLHPGYCLLGEAWLDRVEPVLRIVQHTALALGLPLQSLEAEMGPSQVEAVFDATDALQAADQMMLFRSAVKMALRRAGYHATFMCRPPFPEVMSSGWHLHQSLVELRTGTNAFMRAQPDPGSSPLQAAHTLCDVGEHYLAGLLAHAHGMAALCTATVNGYARFRPNALAPQSVLWGRDNRGAMLRVVGAAGDPATRIENRLGEPAANPYLYLASQIEAGLDGLRQRLRAPAATEDPYHPGAERLPGSLVAALDALEQDAVLVQGLGADVVAWYAQLKRHEAQRFEAASDKLAFQRREYFSRI